MVLSTSDYLTSIPGLEIEKSPLTWTGATNTSDELEINMGPHKDLERNAKQFGTSGVGTYATACILITALFPTKTYLATPAVARHVHHTILGT